MLHRVTYLLCILLLKNLYWLFDLRIATISLIRSFLSNRILELRSLTPCCCILIVCSVCLYSTCNILSFFQSRTANWILQLQVLTITWNLGDPPRHASVPWYCDEISACHRILYLLVAVPMWFDFTPGCFRSRRHCLRLETELLLLKVAICTDAVHGLRACTGAHGLVRLWTWLSWTRVELFPACRSPAHAVCQISVHIVSCVAFLCTSCSSLH